MSFKDISYLAAPLFSKAEPFVKVIFFKKNWTSSSGGDVVLRYILSRALEALFFGRA